MPHQAHARRSHPAKYGEDRFGPPTLERSGSEHRRAVTSPLPEEEGLGEKVELSLQERRRGRKVSTVGRFSSSSLRFLSPGNGGTEGGVKTIEEDRDEFLLQLAIINSYDILNY